VDKGVLAIPEVAKLLRIGQRTAYVLAREGKLPAVPVGSQWRVPKAKSMAWIEAGGQIDNKGLEPVKK